jgi:uncharacterized protein (TIGR00369 family)
MDWNAIVLAPLAPYLDVEFQKTTGSEVVATWTVTPDLHQPTGILHGGVHCTMIEGLASYGAALWYGEEGSVVGVNNTTDFYRSSQTGRLQSVARPIHRGRTTQVWSVETRDEEGRLVARGQVRLQNLKSSSDRPSMSDPIE